MMFYLKFNLGFPLYNGGPVEQDNLFFIHNAGHLIHQEHKNRQQTLLGW